MLAADLGAYCAKLSAKDLPESVAEMAKAKIVDAIGCALAGSSTETAEVLWSYLRASGAKGDVGLWGRAAATSASEAAFINGVQAHALLHDDTDLESGHVACMVVPAALAAAGQLAADGNEVDGGNLLAAMVVGYEVMWRGSGCGAVVTGSLGRGFRGFVINGALGAVAAAGRVLNLTAQQHANAMSCATNAISGLLEPVGVASIERAIMAGNNARTGLVSAMLAKSGMPGTATIFEGPQGYFRAVGGLTDVAVAKLTRDLGKSHRILESLYKCYPSAGANQSAIYAAEIAATRHDFSIDAIKAVHVRQYPLFGDAVPVDKGKPAYPSILSTGPYTNIEETLPNKPFSVASMLANKKYDVGIIKSGLNSPRIQALAKKVTSSGNKAFNPFQADIEILLSDGRRISEHIDCAKESRFYPTLRDMPARLHAMCGGQVELRALERLADAAATIQKPNGVQGFLRVLAGVTAAGNGR